MPEKLDTLKDISLADLKALDPKLYRELLEFCSSLDESEFPDAVLITEGKAVSLDAFAKIYEKLRKRTRSDRERLKEAEKMVLAMSSLSYSEITERRERASPRKAPRVSAGLHPASDETLEMLREKHVKSLESDSSPRLSASESMEMMLAGNEKHVRQLTASGISPVQRFLRIVEGQADGFIEMCSDSRLPNPDRRGSLPPEGNPDVFVYARIAANVVPEHGASLEEMRDSIKYVKKDGFVGVVGHDGPACGGVSEHVKWDKGGRKDTGSHSLNALLGAVHGHTPEENAKEQLGRMESAGAGERNAAALVFNHGKGGMRIVASKGEPAAAEQVVDGWNAANKEAGGPQGMQQKPHVIIVSPPELPFSPHTVIRAEPNEAFLTTGSEHGLDDFDEASVLYAVEHLHVKHISFIAPGPLSEEKKLEKLFGKWEGQIRDMSVHGRKLLDEMLGKGELKISWFRYDLESGAMVSMQGGH